MCLWLPADAVSLWSVRPSASRALGAALWAGHCCFEHADQIRSRPGSSCGQPRTGCRRAGEAVVLGQAQDGGEIVERVAALDVGKAEVVCCVRVPDEGRPGRRLQEVGTYSTMTRSLLGMSDRLRALGVRRVVMEATSDYVRHEGA